MEIKSSDIREYPKNMNDFSESNKKALEQLGFDKWFQDKSKPYIKYGFSIARILEVNRNTYKVCTGRRDMVAELSGKFMYNIETSIDYPTVGDWVVIQCFDNVSTVMIHDTLPRKSLLKRKTPGRDVEFQLIAANIEYALVIQSVDSNFDLNRLERYLVMINESHIQPIVVLNKTDLISANQLSEFNDIIKPFSDKYLSLPISCITGNGIKALQNKLRPHQTYCLLGSSGVGKTTLLNTLLGEDLFDVCQVREKDSKGMHTTIKRHLVRLGSGPIFIDTPGMRELGNFAVDAGLEETFDDIVSRSSQCRFNDCTHTHEDNCAVITAVRQGVIDEDRYNNFVKIQEESAFYETSYVNKKKKDKMGVKQRKNHLKSLKKSNRPNNRIQKKEGQQAHFH